MYHVSFPGLNLDFNISPVAFSIGSYQIYWYGVIIAVGFMLAVFYCSHEAKNHNVDSDKLMSCIIVGLVTAIIGARLYYVVFNWDSFKNDLASVVNIHQGGLAVYGGIIGGLIGGLIMTKFEKIEMLDSLDVVSGGFLIGQSIGRWGNFTNQEAFGTETNLPWRMVSENTYGLGVHPCFLYESLWCALGFVLMFFVWRKRKKFSGELFFIYLVWYGVERAFVEGLRTDSLYFSPLHFRVSQVLSVILALGGAIVL